MNEARMSNEAYAWLSNLAKEIMIKRCQNGVSTFLKPHLGFYDYISQEISGVFAHEFWIGIFVCHHFKFKILFPQNQSFTKYLMKS